MRGHLAETSGVASSADGSQLLSASHDKTIGLWDIATGEETRRCEGYTGLVVLCGEQPASVASTDASWR